MQTTRYWQVLLQEKIPDIYKYLIDADKLRYENYDVSAVKNRQFLEAIIALMLKYEGVIANREEIKTVGLSNGINIFKKTKKIHNPKYQIQPEHILNRIHNIRVIGNEGAHSFTTVTKEQLEDMFVLTKEFAQYFIDNYIDKIIKENPVLGYQEEELGEIQENEIYIFECLKPECKREIRDRNNIKICKKCGGPIKFKGIDANYIPYKEIKTEPLISNIPTFNPTEHKSKNTQPNISDKKNEIIKKHKLEIYSSSLELIKEVVIKKDKIIVGRTSSSTCVDIDLCNVANDENGNCLISREHVHILKKGDGYYVQNVSSKSLVQVNHTKLEYEKASAILQNNDIVILNNFIALVYRVA